MTPYLLRRLINDCCSLEGVCDCYLTFWAFALIIYVLSPYDFLPESVYGVIGLIDDIFLLLIGFFVLARCFYSAYASRHSVPPNAGDELPASSEVPNPPQPGNEVPPPSDVVVEAAH